MDYLLTFMGVATFWLAGNRVWWCWYLGLLTQVVWFVYAITTAQWGFLLGGLFYSAVYIKNAYQWTKEHRELRKKESH